MSTDIRDVVREKYGAIAETETCCGSAPAAGSTSSCGCGCGSPTGRHVAGEEGSLTTLGYTDEQVRAIPKGANLGLGCGNPLAHASVRPGETVLDLGSGAGIDAFLAAREVGPAGRVIGVDMTAAMISRARANAAEGGYANVEFRLGEIEHLPVADGTVDAIISNCVINLSPDKPRVFREAWRVLRPGGRLTISDLVLTKPLPEAVKKSVEAYVGCVAGAMLEADYLRVIQEAGFEPVEVVAARSFGAGSTELPDAVAQAGAWDAVRSIKVLARKPAR